MSAVPYPQSPVQVDASRLQPGESFKKQAVSVVLSIVWFFLLYLLLLAGGILLAVFCIIAGIWVITSITNFIFIMLGVGLMGLGVMVLWFLIKFVFQSNRTDVSKMVQVTEADQPMLFAFLKKLTTETGTPFPRKVFIAPDVNASVFYNSSFWSMFLPVRKNLTIGLGLVNTLNMAEFKAVMAHEFGHFSQRSMKLGSYVYQVNQVMHNMLYDNDGYRNLLQGFANISSYFSPFASLTGHIVSGIQGILQKMYGFINKRYMSLSREMEFHADAVAASVAGGNQLVHALRRIEMADAAWNTVMDQYNAWVGAKKMGANAYADQTAAMGHLTSFFKLPTLRDGIPEIPDSFFEGNQKRRVNITNQWASHPERAEREAHLNDLGWTTPENHLPAWQLFENIPALQEQLTRNVYSSVEWAETPEVLETTHFVAEQDHQREYYSYPESYRGYFDARFLAPFDPEQVYEKWKGTSAELGDILQEEQFNLNSKLAALNEDIALLKALAEGKSDIRSFDFEGAKYPVEDAETILKQLEAEQEALLAMQKETDEKLACLAMEKDSDPETAKLKYSDYFAFSKAANEFMTAVQGLFGRLQPLFQGQQLQIEDAQILANYLKSTDLVAMGDAWKLLGASPLFSLETDLRNAITAMLLKDYTFFRGDTFLDDELKEAMDISDAGFSAVQKNLFDAHKALLVWQAERITMEG
jgi:Zn-dependent protease with chaperone function